MAMQGGGQGGAAQLLQWLQEQVPDSDDEAQEAPERSLLMQLAHQAATPAPPGAGSQQVMSILMYEDS